MSQAEPELDPVLEFDRQPEVAFVETDRYCEGCGYNLRTQPVRREARTRVLLCRCPECGGFQPVREGITAGRAWLQRLGTLGLLLWIVTLLSVWFGLGAAQVGFAIIPLEELTRYRQVVIPAPPAQSQPAAGGATTTMTTTSGQRITITQSGTTTTTTYRREVREYYPYYRAFMALMHASSFGLGFLLTLIAVVVLHHWRRWGYLVSAVFVSLATGLLTWYVWSIECPHLLDWSEPIIARQSAAHLAGALTGILLGRPFARLLATLMLPGKLRQVLAFLWLVDGKRPPTVGATS
jgi:hypothetical protein